MLNWVAGFTAGPVKPLTSSMARKFLGAPICLFRPHPPQGHRPDVMRIHDQRGDSIIAATLEGLPIIYRLPIANPAETLYHSARMPLLNKMDSALAAQGQPTPPTHIGD